jgi:hypothetical protein
MKQARNLSMQRQLIGQGLSTELLMVLFVGLMDVIPRVYTYYDQATAFRIIHNSLLMDIYRGFAQSRAWADSTLMKQHLNVTVQAQLLRITLNNNHVALRVS